MLEIRHILLARVLHTSAMKACVIHCMVSSGLDDIPKREITSRSMNLFLELFQVVDKIATKHLRVMSRILKVRFMELMHAPRRVWRHENVVLKNFSMCSGIRWR